MNTWIKIGIASAVLSIMLVLIIVTQFPQSETTVVKPTQEIVQQKIVNPTSLPPDYDDGKPHWAKQFENDTGVYKLVDPIHGTYVLVEAKNV